MLLIRRILTVSLSIVGGLFAIISLALINSLTNANLTGGQVVLYGLLTGVVIGVFAGYLVMFYLVRKLRNLFSTVLQMLSVNSRF
jgi:uncharacterized membrane protein